MRELANLVGSDAAPGLRLETKAREDEGGSKRRFGEDTKLRELRRGLRKLDSGRGT